MGLGKAGLDLQGFLVMGDGLVDQSAASQGVAEVVVDLGQIGIDLQGVLAVGDDPSPT